MITTQSQSCITVEFLSGGLLKSRYILLVQVVQLISLSHHQLYSFIATQPSGLSLFGVIRRGVTYPSISV